MPSIESPLVLTIVQFYSLFRWSNNDIFHSSSNNLCRTKSYLKHSLRKIKSFESWIRDPSAPLRCSSLLSWCCQQFFQIKHSNKILILIYQYLGLYPMFHDDFEITLPKNNRNLGRKLLNLQARCPLMIKNSLVQLQHHPHTPLLALVPLLFWHASTTLI